jgi:hypothetical protein
MYSVTHSFQTNDELFKFVSMLEKHSRQEKKRNEHDDKRGSHMAEFHQKAKILKEEHPEMSYRECMANIKKELK